MSGQGSGKIDKATYHNHGTAKWGLPLEMVWIGASDGTQEAIFRFLDGFDHANVTPVRAHYGHARLDVSRIRAHDDDLLGHAAWQRTQNGQEQAVCPSPVTGHPPASTIRDKIHLYQPGHRKCNAKQYSFFHLSLPGPLIAP